MDSMKNVDALVDLLREIDGRGYKAYKAVHGTWAFPGFVLHVDHVQGDPFATPSRVRALLPPDTTGLAPEACSTASRRLGVASLLARRFHQAALATVKARGTGKSGIIEIESPGQEVVAHTAVIVAEDGSLEARFTVGLPATGRRVLGEEAADLLSNDVPAVVSYRGIGGSGRSPAPRSHERRRRRLTAAHERPWLGRLRSPWVLAATTQRDRR